MLNFLFLLSGIANALKCPLPRVGARLVVYEAEEKCIYIYDKSIKKDWMDSELECTSIQEAEDGEKGVLGRVATIESNQIIKLIRQDLFFTTV